MRSLSLAGIWTPRLYDRIAGYYDALSFLISPQSAHRKVTEDLHSGSILDVGCGTGTLLQMANANGMECFGIDTSIGMLKQVRIKVPDAKLVQASFYELPFPDDVFDVVVETNALGGVAINVKQALSEMIKVCKVGCEVRIVDFGKPVKETWKTTVLQWIGALFGDTPYDYVQIFETFGFKTEVEILGGSGMYHLCKVKKVK
ncbi:MAG: methyltransferase domain-containing protein [Anaerolineales bacterium]|nr:methyltransferase domain-containing protein [Anaerolineales bacterium]